MRKAAFLATAVLAFLGGALAQRGPALSPEEAAISTEIRTLRSLPDDVWVQTVGKLARQIQQLPDSSPNKIALIANLGNLVTEGDAGHDTLQVVASTMAQALRAEPKNPVASTLAQLVRYEHVSVSSDDPAYLAATAKLEALDVQRASPRFTLKDLKGAEWSLESLRGKVVLVNFWATWCPPCRKEMPDMEALYQRFAARGLVVLAISDEDAATVQKFLDQQKFTYPILLDPGRKVNALFGVEGIPKSFLYGRDGKLAAEAIDRRTEGQFLAMFKLAGLE
jgi:peroxiredoxin